MANLKGKRLLILGGGLWCDAIKKYADEQEITLIATGNSKASNIFKIADEAHLINSTDAEKMKALIRENNIDGVYMGGSEPVISVACEYLNELGLPCYCTKAQWEFLENKANFKELCNKHGLPTVPKYTISEADLEKGMIDLPYPVITKPEDGCGSNGFSVNNNTEELKAGYNIAKEASPTGSVLVEKFVNNKSVVVFYTFANGEMFFSGLEDKYTVHYKEQSRYVAGAHIFESRSTEKFRALFDDKLKAMFEDIGIKEGSLWIEVFHGSENEYYFNEVGYRYSGSVSMYPVDYFYGINQVALDINYALEGKLDPNEIKNTSHLMPSHLVRKKKYCIYSLHIRAGKICAVEGLDELRRDEHVVVIPTTKNIGDTVSSSGTVSQVFAFVHFVFDTQEELESIVDRIHRDVKILDENGENMLARLIDCKDIKNRTF